MLAGEYDLPLGLVIGPPLSVFSLVRFDFDLGGEERIYFHPFKAYYGYVNELCIQPFESENSVEEHMKTWITKIAHDSDVTDAKQLEFCS